MSRTLTSARVLYALAFLGFALQFLRILPTIGPPWHRTSHVFSIIYGIILLVAAMGLLIRPYQKIAAWVLAFYLSERFLRLTLFHLPQLLANRQDPNMWAVLGELLALAGGAWMLYSILPATHVTFPRTLAAGRYIFAATLVIFGILHFIYAFFISLLIPHWIPERFFFANFAGLCFICAALALVTGIRARLAAYLLAAMFLIWVAILHAPRVAHAIHNGNEWTSLFIAIGMAASSLAAAESLRPQFQK